MNQIKSLSHIPPIQQSVKYVISSMFVNSNCLLQTSRINVTFSLAARHVASPIPVISSGPEQSMLSLVSTSQRSSCFSISDLEDRDVGSRWHSVWTTPPASSSYGEDHEVEEGRVSTNVSRVESHTFVEMMVACISKEISLCLLVRERL